jgi:HD-GYP domain-containing protein (c-di-GMP phosphodiesterase class II)
LIVTHTDARGVECRTEVSGERLSVGRDDGCSIQILNPYVSRRHGEIRWQEGSWQYVDLESTSGSFHNGQSVREVDLRDGSVVNLGRPDGVPLQFEIPGDETTAEIEDPFAQNFVHSVRPDDTRYLSTLGTLEVPTLDAANRAKRLQALYNLSSSMLDASRTDQVPYLLIDNLRPLFPKCRKAVLLHLPGGDGDLHLAATSEAFSPSMSVARHVYQNDVGVVSVDAAEDERFDASSSIMMHGISSVLCVPVSTAGRRWGVLYVDTIQQGRGMFNNEELDFFAACGRQAAQAMDSMWLATELQRTLESMMKTLAASIDAKDYLTAGHSNRVAHYSKRTAQYLGLGPEEIHPIYYAALLHDYGKIGVEDAVLKKPGSLTNEEFEHVKQHARYTFDILSRIHFPPALKELAFVAATHHERVDGKGYPFGLTENEIPIGGQIISVVDVYDSLTQKRHYRDPMPEQDVIELLEEGRGTRFRGDVLDAFKRYHAQELLPQKLKKAQRRADGVGQAGEEPLLGGKPDSRFDAGG